MNKERGVDVLGLAIGIAIFAILAATLWPIVSRYHLSASRQGSACQSNLTQIGRSLRMYLTDYDDTYPTNRPRSSGSIASSVALSPYDPVNMKRFVNGINWVEGLYPYMESTSAAQSRDTNSWNCDECLRATCKGRTDASDVSYVFNRNLVELQDQSIKNRANLMMVREADRLLDADLRPTNLSIKNRDVSPISPFLTRRDARMGTTNPELHDNGSNILFADGHVKHFDAEYYTDKPAWDPETQQWWNFVGSNSKRTNKTIAITP